MTARRTLLLGAIVTLACMGGGMRADGTEQLGTPSITIASGTGVVAAGTGMLTQPGSMTVDVPVAASVEQVLLYWEGFNTDDTGEDDTIVVNGTQVVGTLIGGPTLFFPGAWASTFRADITALGLVTPGISSLTVSGLDFTLANNGAGVLVVIDDGGTNTSLQIRDGSDLAFVNFAPPLDTTVPQTFTFAASNKARSANLNLFFASVSGTLSGDGKRPTAIRVTTNGPNGTTTWFDNQLDSNSGQEWDTLPIFINVPAGATSATVQALSTDRLGVGGLPASFDWVAASFALQPTLGTDGRMTGGGSVFTIDDVRVTRGFEIHCDLREPNNIEVNWPGNKFHMTSLTGALCTDDPAIDQTPPNSAPFDTFEGEGVGKLNNRPGARIEFVFVDAGEPGTSDTASIKVFDANNVLVLDVTGDPSVPGFLDKGNIQAHKDNK